MQFLVFFFNYLLFKDVDWLTVHVVDVASPPQDHPQAPRSAHGAPFHVRWSLGGLVLEHQQLVQRRGSPHGLRARSKSLKNMEYEGRQKKKKILTSRPIQKEYPRRFTLVTNSRPFLKSMCEQSGEAMAWRSQGESSRPQYCISTPQWKQTTLSPTPGELEQKTWCNKNFMTKLKTLPYFLTCSN